MLIVNNNSFLSTYIVFLCIICIFGLFLEVICCKINCNNLKLYPLKNCSYCSYLNTKAMEKIMLLFKTLALEHIYDRSQDSLEVLICFFPHTCTEYSNTSIQNLTVHDFIEMNRQKDRNQKLSLVYI